MRNCTMAAAPKAGKTVAVLVIHTAALAHARLASAAYPARALSPIERIGAPGSGAARRFHRRDTDGTPRGDRFFNALKWRHFQATAATIRSPL